MSYDPRKHSAAQNQAAMPATANRAKRLSEPIAGANSLTLLRNAGCKMADIEVRYWGWGMCVAGGVGWRFSSVFWRGYEKGQSNWNRADLMVPGPQVTHEVPSDMAK
ncbi:hypothetical protein chiPu_0023705 [Chiloscyllium punctatum]|uniref:Uncharacterized protein n=1 Tax=Chiloscyllium punctatum TaxID=137246 RepID=A0A401TAH8_CHIPU|nr:hypothetical protein [Chiloscyllium punctatum]